jgi:hypothetical protein
MGKLPRNDGVGELLFLAADFIEYLFSQFNDPYPGLMGIRTKRRNSMFYGTHIAERRGKALSFPSFYCLFDFI